jgi:hypothetical protein
VTDPPRELKRAQSAAVNTGAVTASSMAALILQERCRRSAGGPARRCRRPRSPRCARRPCHAALVVPLAFIVPPTDRSRRLGSRGRPAARPPDVRSITGSPVGTIKPSPVDGSRRTRAARPTSRTRRGEFRRSESR